MGQNARHWTRGVINQDLINVAVPLRDDVQYRSDDSRVTQRVHGLIPTIPGVVSLRLLLHIFN